MDLIGAIAPIIQDERAIWTVVAILALWAGDGLRRLIFGTKKLVRALKEAHALLLTAENAQAFAESYEDLNQRLAVHPILGERWREFEESLIVPARHGQPVRSTARPSTWFDAGLLSLPAVGLDVRYHAAMPNLLVGAGLLFTFLGLTVALATASGVVAGAADVRNEALKVLLLTASFKFITSLAGMGLSILYAIVRKWRLLSVDHAVDAFLVALGKRVPLLTPVALQIEQNALLERQADRLETFSADLAISLGSAVDQTFNERLAQHVGPLTEAMNKLSERIASQNQDAMQGMLDAFVKRLEGGTGEHMDLVAHNLSALGGRLESLADSLRGVAEDTRKAGADAGGAMADRMAAATAAFEQAARNIADKLAEAAGAMERQMGEQATESSGRLAGQFEAMLAELRALAEASRRSGAEALEQVARKIGDAATGFEATSRQVSEALERAAAETGGRFEQGSQEAVAQIAAATSDMRNGLKATLDGAAGDLARAMAEASLGLAEAGGAFGDKAGALAAQIVALGGAADRLGVHAVAFERTAAAAMTPLSQSTADLKAAGQAAREAVEPLARTGLAVTQVSERMSGAAQRLEATATASTRLAASLDQASQRFEGVDRELAKTLNELQKGLAGFTTQIRDFVDNVDKDFAKAATHLAQVVKTLEDTLGDFEPPKRH